MNTPDAKDKTAQQSVAPSSRNDGATAHCPMCGRSYTVSGRARYCSEGCRKKAWRRRRQPAPIEIVVPPAGRSLRLVTVYECGMCGTRAIGEQRCEDCGTFMAKVGIGGLCPHCDGVVAISDLLDDAVLAPRLPEKRRA